MNSLKNKILSQLELPTCSGEWYIMDGPINSKTINDKYRRKKSFLMG